MMEHKLQMYDNKVKMSTEDIKENTRKLVQRFDRSETKLDHSRQHRMEKVEFGPHHCWGMVIF